MTDFVISDAPAFSGDQFDELCKARPARGGSYYKRIVLPSGKLKYFRSKAEYVRWCEDNEMEPHVDGERALRERTSPTPAKHSTYSGSGAGSAAEEQPKKSGGSYNPAMGKSEASVDEFDALMKGAGGAYTGKGKRTGSPGHYKYSYDDEAKHGHTDIPEYKLRVVGESHAEISKKLKAGIAASADICKTNPPVCAGNLGIERKDMPQFDDEANPNVVSEYLQAFRDKGVKVEKKRIPAGKLKATQKEIQTKKAYGMAKAYHEHKEGKGKWAPNLKEVVVSSDGYILDGHHRWAATTIANPADGMPVYQVDAPIKDLLAMSEKFYREGRGVKKAGFAAASIGAGVAKKSMTAGEAYAYGKWRERINKAVVEANDRLAKAGHLDEFELLKAYPTGAPTLGELMVGRMTGKVPRGWVPGTRVQRQGDVTITTRPTAESQRARREAQAKLPPSPGRALADPSGPRRRMRGRMKGKQGPGPKRVSRSREFPLTGKQGPMQRGVTLTPTAASPKPPRPPKMARTGAQMARVAGRAGFGPTRR